MKRLFILVFCVMNLLVLQGAWAKEEGAQSLGKSLKKAGDSIGSGMHGAGQAVAKDVKKVDDGLGKILKQTGKTLK